MKTEIMQFVEYVCWILGVQIADACKADRTTEVSWEKKKLETSTEGIFYRDTLTSSEDA